MKRPRHLHGYLTVTECATARGTSLQAAKKWATTTAKKYFVEKDGARRIKEADFYRLTALAMAASKLADVEKKLRELDELVVEMDRRLADVLRRTAKLESAAA